uniref:V-type proton ATPase subunit F n=1 Tax=Rhizophora mucronata TaxID=61149 RepID=A0A2P2JHY4_RHIMU
MLATYWLIKTIAMSSFEVNSLNASSIALIVVSENKIKIITKEEELIQSFLLQNIASILFVQASCSDMIQKSGMHITVVKLSADKFHG